MGGARSPTPPTIEEKKAFVRGLTEECNEDMLTQVFSKYGRVTEVYLAREFETKVPRGFAFVTFESGKDCEDACKALNGKEFRGKLLHVERSAKPRGSGSSRGYRGGRGRSGYMTRGGRSPPHSSKDYDYKSHASSGRDDRNYSRGSHRPYPSRGGRTRGPSPPPREYDYHARSSPMLSHSRGDKYYADAVTARDRYYRDAFDAYPKGGPEYPRSRYDLEYRAARPRHDYSPPPPRREYEAVGRTYPGMPSREYYDYPAINGRYSPGPPRRDYESSRGYGAYSSRIGPSYARTSPPRAVPREYAPQREIGSIRRPQMRSISPPPKRMKSSQDSYERRASPQRGAPVSRRF